jgi:HEAT repeat protein
VDSLIQSLKNADWYVRWGAVEALGNIGDPRALDPIRDMLHDKDEYVRRAAEDAIRKIERKNG